MFSPHSGNQIKDVLLTQKSETVCSVCVCSDMCVHTCICREQTNRFKSGTGLKTVMKTLIYFLLYLFSIIDMSQIVLLKCHAPFIHHTNVKYVSTQI